MDKERYKILHAFSWLHFRRGCLVLCFCCTAGKFLFLVDRNFFDSIVVNYEVCSLSKDCENDDNACQEGRLILYDDELQDMVPTNLFTPNDDGLDDQLRFTVNPIVEDSELWIYNRWGNLIFHMKEYDNRWDGSGYPGGVYYYVLRIKEAELKRTLTVVK